jgi:hypothetical protein
LVRALAQAQREIGDHELRAIRHDQEVLRHLARALSAPGVNAPEPKPPSAAEDITMETPALVVAAGDTDLIPARESRWRQLATNLGLAILTLVGVIAFLIAL